MSARAALRAATAADHERVDALFSHYDLATLDGYRRFLLAQAVAFLPAEEMLTRAGASRLIKDWDARRRSVALRADLGALGETVPEQIPAPDFVTDASVLGGIYVLEGSRLGGALLKRGIPASVPRAFLDAEQGSGAWRKLLERLEIFLYRTDLVEAAAGAARQTFQCFEAGGLRYLRND